MKGLETTDSHTCDDLELCDGSSHKQITIDQMPDMEEGGQEVERTQKDFDNVSSTSNSSSSNNMSTIAHRRFVFSWLIVFVGMATSAAFLALGIVKATNEQEDRFEQLATEFAKAIEDAWDDYELFGLWIHESCRSHDGRSSVGHLPSTAGLSICSRTEFRELYEYIQSVGLDFQSAQFMPNVTHDLRDELEAEARAYYEQNYPNVNYRGIIGLDSSSGSIQILPREEHPFYYPVHYVEPVEGNEAAIELDLWTSAIQRKTIIQATSTWKPALSDRLRLVQETDPNAFGIILHHPGVPLSTTRNHQTQPSGISLMVIRIPALLTRAAQLVTESQSVYLYDSSDTTSAPLFLGAADVIVENGVTSLTNLPETELVSIPHDHSGRIAHRNLKIADRHWRVAVVSLPGTYEANTIFVVLGGCIILASSLVLSIWFHTHLGRALKMNEIRSEAEREKAAIIVETARRQAVAERQLNEYIAHEVRNPLSSAIAALSFVSAATNEPIADEQTRQTVKDDISIIDASLQFINELLRNMLDMHRAASQQMHINMSPTDVLRDVLEPVAAILYMRGNKVEVRIHCPPNLYVMSDRLRLKQIVLNLAINASKFVEQGFIRLHAKLVDGNVQIYLEDSGPGIPAEKRGRLFAKFQESLDLLNQGTGIGLCLCKHLAVLMGGDIWMDESFHSGIEGCPGTRFILDLKVPPLQIEHDDLADEAPGSDGTGSTHEAGSSERSHPCETSDEDKCSTHSEIVVPEPDLRKLPEHLNVLFVDDDLVLRKLFCRSLRRVAPGWNVKEAANGESALVLVDSEDFDVIFLDQYMASIEKQLLGTETARALRAKGVKSKICGLSANDKEQAFQEAGADCFIFKPFPCEKEALRLELERVWFGPVHQVLQPWKEPVE